MKSVTLGSLCKNCQKFQIERLFGVVDAKDANHIYFDLVPGGCGLCNFFTECLPERCKVRSGDGTWSVCVNSASSAHARDPAHVEVRCYPPKKQDGILGGILMTVCSERINFDNQRAQVSPFACVSIGCSESHKLQAPTPSLDLAPISDWLNKERRTQQARWYKGKDDVGLALTVIDCDTRTLVPLLKEEVYATLSYVWGRAVQSPLDSTNGNRLPLHLPDTIQDSIDVCNALGIRYLWVDRYCISNESSHLRGLQISRMDEVYQNSFLTIVACAGGDPDYGLPGISRRRNPNPCIEVVGLGYIGALSQYDEVHAGIWATRAWTYQEALLSQRQIYFTDKETFFGSAERIQEEIGAINKSSLEQFLPEGWRTGHPVPETGGNLYDRSLRNYSLGRLHVWKCISDYSMRTLSYQSDILNALLGILAYYRRENGICHLWGIPFSTFVPMPTPAQPTHLDFDMGLRWVTNGPSSRREGFPSWSWTGHHGHVQHNGPGAQYNVATTKEEAIEIEVELTSGRLVKWLDYQADYANMQDYGRAHSPDENTDQPSQFIHIEALTSRIVANHPVNRGTDYYSMDASTIAPEKMEHFGSVESPSCTKSHAEVEESLPVGSLLALHFPNLGAPSSSGALDNRSCISFCNDGCALLIQNFGEHWERVCMLGGRTVSTREELHKVRRKVRLG